MTLTLNLPPDLEHRLIQQAERQGLPTDQYVISVLDRHVPAEDRSAQLVAVLQSWIDEEDAEEQQETGDYLVRVLDEDRLSDRKLFPPELEGVTW